LIYPDLISGREETPKNKLLLKGMKSYANGDYGAAVEDLNLHLDKFPKDDGAYLYKAVSQLELGKPYDAELTLDKIENLPDPAFSDQVDYYNTLALICSAQYERALEHAYLIKAKGHHTYSEQAESIIEDLTER
jgi:hypothetical protein